MLIGLISDSHDNLPKILSAVKTLNTLNVERVLHAGDYCAPFAATSFKDLKAKMYGVFGNNDAERERLQEKFQTLGHEVKGRFQSIDVDNLKVALTHGDEPELLQALKTMQTYDLVVFGHSHSLNQSQNGRTLMLNPGEICGYLTGRSTIATFDTKTRHIEILDI